MLGFSSPVPGAAAVLVLRRAGLRVDFGRAGRGVFFFFGGMLALLLAPDVKVSMPPALP
jgi:hypothetical protein